MSDRFSLILEAAIECAELANTLEKNLQDWNRAVDDIFAVGPPRWRGPKADEARKRINNINDFVTSTPFATKLDTAAEHLCDWWEDQVDRHNQQRYEKTLEHYQQRLNAHLAIHEEFTGVMMGIFGENPTSAAVHVREPSKVRELGGRPSPPNYTVTVSVFIHYVIEEPTHDGGWPYCYHIYRDYP